VKAKLRGGKKTAATPKTSPTPSPTLVTPAGTGVVEPPAKEIRAWAREAGLEVPDTGKLPQKVRDAYAAAHVSGRAA
jgi:predicted Rdx family selenoprotein